MSKPTILLVDYDPRSIEATAQPLTELGYHVEVAKDGLAGIEAYRRLSPDLVLLEMMLPKKHGLEVCQELRRAPSARRTPIVILGRTVSERYRAQAVSAGANDYVTRPLASDKLVELCNNYLMEEPELFVAAENAEGPDPISAIPAPPKDLDLGGMSDDEILARLDALLPSDPEAPMPAPPQSPAPAVVADAAPAPTTEPVPMLEPIPVPVEAPAAEAPPPPRKASGARATTVSPPAAFEPPLLGAPSPSRFRPILVGACVVAAVAGVVYFFVLRGPTAAPETAAARPEQFVPRVPVLPQTSAPAPAAAETPAPAVSAPAASRPEPPVSAPAPAPATASSEAPAATHPQPLRPAPAETVRPAAPPVRTPPLTPGPQAASRPAADADAADTIVEGGVAGVPDVGLSPTAPAARADAPSRGVAAGALVELSEVDTAPVPRSRTQPTYPAVALRIRTEARVVLRLLVDESGRVASVEADAGENASTFAAEARKAARTWTYTPAMKDGVPVKVWIVEKITFRP